MAMVWFTVRGPGLSDVVARLRELSALGARVRAAALDAWPDTEVPGDQFDWHCGSGLQAFIKASMSVRTGAPDRIIAGGAQSISRAEHCALGIRCGPEGRAPTWSAGSAAAGVTSGGGF